VQASNNMNKASGTDSDDTTDTSGSEDPLPSSSSAYQRTKPAPVSAAAQEVAAQPDVVRQVRVRERCVLGVRSNVSTDARAHAHTCSRARMH